MKDIGKISVKHFLNKNIPIHSKSSSTVRYPVYLKITFQRKSTEVRSVAFFCSESEEEFMNIPQYKFNQEISMVEFFVRKGFVEQSDRFTFKGISDLCKDYYNKTIHIFYTSFVLNDFDKFLSEQKDYLKHILIHRDKNVPSFLYYIAAYKLLDNKEGLKQFEDKFNVIKFIEMIDIPYYGSLSLQKLYDWQFGDLKVAFLKSVKNYNLIDKEINDIITLIDNGITKLMS